MHYQQSILNVCRRWIHFCTQIGVNIYFIITPISTQWWIQRRQTFRIRLMWSIENFFHNHSNVRRQVRFMCSIVLTLEWFVKYLWFQIFPLQNMATALYSCKFNGRLRIVYISLILSKMHRYSRLHHHFIGGEKKLRRLPVSNLFSSSTNSLRRHLTAVQNFHATRIFNLRINSFEGFFYFRRVIERNQLLSTPYFTTNSDTTTSRKFKCLWGFSW